MGLLFPSPPVPQGLWRLKALSEAQPLCQARAVRAATDGGEEEIGSLPWVRQGVTYIEK